MDSDKDGLISSNKVNFSALPFEIIEAFTPMQVEMEKYKTIYDFETFYEIADQLL